MDQEQQTRIDELIVFHADLKRYASEVGAFEEVHRAWRRGSHSEMREPLMGNDLEHLRQDLLRRSGVVRPLFERLAGRIIQPGPWGSGRHDAWDLALVGHRDFYRASFANTIADMLLTVIGRLEADPALLDPPAAASPSSGSILRPINIVYGGTVNIAQTGAGAVSQAIEQKQELHEIQQLVGALQEAIRAVDAPEAEVEGFLEPVERLNRELRSSKPLLSRLTTG